MHCIITPRSVLWIVLGYVLVSIIAAVTYVLFQRVAEVRRLCVTLGFLSALSGTAVALWFSLRMRAVACFGAAASSLPSLVFWVWTIYEKVHVP